MLQLNIPSVFQRAIFSTDYIRNEDFNASAFRVSTLYEM